MGESRCQPAADRGSVRRIAELGSRRRPPEQALKRPGHAEAGMHAAIHLILIRRQLTGPTTEHWPRVLEEALLAA